jgi:hypothetical protein
MGIADRIARLEREARRRPPPDQLYFVLAVPIGEPLTGGRSPGLYRDGPPGSTAGVLVFDPAAGAPEVPNDQLPPWALMVVNGLDEVELPLDDSASSGGAELARRA